MAARATRKGDHGGAWDEDRVARLRELLMLGKTASQIAYALGGKITRSAVIGKVHRLGPALNVETKSARDRKLDRARSSGKRRASKPKQPATIRVMIPEPIPQRREDDVARKQLADLDRNDCKFPVGDPGTPGFGFCASGRVEGLPYCADHAARCYVTPNNLKSRSKDTSDVSDACNGRVRLASDALARELLKA